MANKTLIKNLNGNWVKIARLANNTRLPLILKHQRWMIWKHQWFGVSDEIRDCTEKRTLMSISWLSQCDSEPKNAPLTIEYKRIFAFYFSPNPYLAKKATHTLRPNNQMFCEAFDVVIILPVLKFFSPWLKCVHIFSVQQKKSPLAENTHTLSRFKFANLSTASDCGFFLNIIFDAIQNIPSSHCTVYTLCVFFFLNRYDANLIGERINEYLR